MSDTRPSVLVLGATGVVGRSFVEFLVNNSLAYAIRAVDKRVPPRAFLNRPHMAAFQSDVVDFLQADLAEDDHVARVFRRESGAGFDIVVCCAAETGFGRDADRYTKTVDIAAKCGRAALETGVRKFVYLSTAAVYKADKTPAKETGKLDPWTTPATHQLLAEQELGKISGLNYVILRPATVYGIGDEQGLMARAVCAATYTKLGEKMQFLWGADMRLNTVHVRDVVGAIWHVAQRTDPAGTVFNLADKGASDQGKISAILGAIFGIKTGFHGKIVSNLARMALETAVETANDKHLAPWMELLREHSIEHTPLSPFIHIELLRQNHLSIDGSAIEKTGFRYTNAELTLPLLLESIQDHIAHGRFPPVVSGEAATAAVISSGAGAGGDDDE